jgi:hypothetical protein
MHVVVADILTNTAEVAAAACGKRCAEKNHGNNRKEAREEWTCRFHRSHSGFDRIKAGLFYLPRFLHANRSSGFPGIDLYSGESGSGAAAATAARSRALLGTASPAGLLTLAVDADDRQNHNDPHRAVRRAIHR